MLGDFATSWNHGLHPADSSITKIEVYINDFCFMIDVLDKNAPQAIITMHESQNPCHSPLNIIGHNGDYPISEKKRCEGKGT